MESGFKIKSEYSPMGDQPEAIRQLSEGIESGVEAQTLQGVTGSGKTFTIANVIQNVQRPTLILSHNKTLAAQLYGEFKSFFPDNAVEYFVSYYDYYQPEAYIPNSDTYIEKDLAINDEIEKLRLATTTALLSGRRDIVVISSVSCLFGMGNPEDFYANTITIKRGQELELNTFLRMLSDNLYERNEIDFDRGKFRVKGDTVDIFMADTDYIVRVSFWGDEIEEITSIDPIDNLQIDEFEQIRIYPASLFITTKERIDNSLKEIRRDLDIRVAEFKDAGRDLEAKRLYERVNYDMEMISELGRCSGIENYSRYFDGRKPGTRPFCLLDFFPADFLLVIDESHVTIPQIRGMYGGDRARKENLVEYGFRLPAAKDNRPLTFDEFQELTHQTIYVSATPAEFELERSGGIVVEQIIRPTGLLDPVIEVRPTEGQIDDLIDEIQNRITKDERTLVTTLTKRMAEELQNYLEKMGIRSRYIHSDVDTIERVKIMEDLRDGVFDVLVGVNLLREGLDLPEVSLVAILDADKEGFLRSHRSLTQTVGRAARNLNGLAIMYADNITESMQQTIEETERRREKQATFNKENGITPKAINKERKSILIARETEEKTPKPVIYETANSDQGILMAAEPKNMNKEEIEKLIEQTKAAMKKAAKNLEFIQAAQLRDEVIRLETILVSIH